MQEEFLRYVRNLERQVSRNMKPLSVLLAVMEESEDASSSLEAVQVDGPVD